MEPVQRGISVGRGEGGAVRIVHHAPAVQELMAKNDSLTEGLINYSAAGRVHCKKYIMKVTYK